MNCSNFVNIIVYCINVYMYANNVLLTNTCNMYEIKILLLYCTNMYCCQLWFNSTKISFIKLSTSYNSVLRRLLCISKPYSASNIFLFLEVFLPLLNYCVNLSIDLKTELSLVQTLSLQHVYHH